MSLPEVVSREQWLEARVQLLSAEKEMTRRRDELNSARRMLPMVRIEKDYRFEGPDGQVPLTALFGDHSQLIVRHVMFDPSWEAACPGCTAAVDEISDGLREHLHSRDTEYALVSRAPLATLQAYAELKGWTMPWYSSYGSDFNYDFQATQDATVAPVMHNYRDADALRQAGMDWVLEGSQENPGVSCFVRDGNTVFHTYSTYGRGNEGLGDAYGLLDLTAFGRQETWEQPQGRAPSVHGADPTFTD